MDGNDRQAAVDRLLSGLLHVLGEAVALEPQITMTEVRWSVAQLRRIVRAREITTVSLESLRRPPPLSDSAQAKRRLRDARRALYRLPPDKWTAEQRVLLGLEE